jgi:DNA repair protein RecN (Recombination protein N)
MMSATLASLRIRNLALVEDLLWEPPGGFVAVTGETGAGKSIILGAVKLLLGERADRTLVRSGAESCAVEGLFRLSAESPVHALLESVGAEPCEEGTLIVKRSVPTEGVGKQFVNGSPCTLALLREIGVALVDLHGPHDHQSLFAREQQMRVLDSFADAEKLRPEYSEKRRLWIDLENEQRRLVESAEALARELDLLTHQTQEIDAAALQPGEEESLIARQRTASNAQRLGEVCTELTGILTESEDSITSRWGDVGRLARELQRLDPAAEPIAQAVAGIFDSLQDLARDIDHYSNGVEADPRALAEIEARLDTIQGLKRKYGPTVEAILEFGQNALEKLSSLKNREERGSRLDAEIQATRAAVDTAGKKLSQARRKAAPKLEALARRHLADLGFSRAGFSIAFEDLAEPSPEGFERIEFLFAPNPGEPERPLRAIASSGEISRVMLALKTSLAAQDSVPILIFDEIDANVGGEIGAKVGLKMCELAASHQVFCITHLPQVAASAESQFIVSKETDGARTRTLLAATTPAERITEIARMLGGPADTAKKHARTLLGEK